MNQPAGRNSSTILKIKEATKKTQISKWQSRLDNTEYGRAYHMLVAKVESKKFLDIPNRKSFCLILQIQTGYSKLNDYRYKLGQCDSNKCACGEPETLGLSKLPTVQRNYAAEAIIPTWFKHIYS